MKNQSQPILVIAVLLATAFTSAQGQTATRIAANIPFNFVIKDRALAAGEYVFELVQVGGSDTVRIQSADGLFTALIPARSAGAKAPQTEPKSSTALISLAAPHR